MLWGSVALLQPVLELQQMPGCPLHQIGVNSGCSLRCAFPSPPLPSVPPKGSLCSHTCDTAGQPDHQRLGRVRRLADGAEAADQGTADDGLILHCRWRVSSADPRNGDRELPSPASS